MNKKIFALLTIIFLTLSKLAYANALIVLDISVPNGPKKFYINFFPYWIFWSELKKDSSAISLPWLGYVAMYQINSCENNTCGMPVINPKLKLPENCKTIPNEGTYTISGNLIATGTLAAPQYNIENLKCETQSKTGK